MTRQNNAVTLAPIVILTQNTLIWKKKWDDVNNVWRWRNVNKSCRIPNTWSKILIFLNNELLSSKSWKIMTKSSLTQVSYYCFEKRCYIFLKMLTFFKKKCWCHGHLGGYWYYKVYFLKLHVSELTYQISSFWRNLHEFQETGGWLVLHLPQLKNKL